MVNVLSSKPSCPRWSAWQASIIAIVIGTLCIGMSSASGQSLPTASVDRDLIGPGDTVQLTVSVESRGRVQFGMPSGGDFSVVGQTTATNSTSVNGRMRTVASRIYALRPNGTGNLTVGPVRVSVNGTVHETTAIPVLVDADAVAAQERAALAPVRPRRGTGVPDDQPIPRTSGVPSAPSPQSAYMYDSGIPRVEPGEPFVTSRVSEIAPVVGEPFVIDYVIFTPRSALDVDLTDLTEPEFEDVWFREVTQQRRDYFGGRWSTSQRVGSELYEAQIFRTYVLVPMEPGELELPSIETEVLMRGFFRDSGTRVIRSQPLLIDVQEAPSPQPDGYREGNVGRLDFRASVDREHARVGDAVTLTLRATGAARMAGIRLPELPSMGNARVFDPDDDSDERFGRTGWLEGHVERRFTIVPEEEGLLRIPEISFTWYDPFLDDYVTESTGPYEVSVEGVRENANVGQEERDDTWMEPLPSLRPISSSPALGPRPPSGPLFWLALGCAPLLVVSVVARDRMRARSEASAPERRRQSAGRDALQRLAAISASSPDAPRELLRTLHDYLDLRLGSATRGLRRGALHAAVRARLNTSMADALVGLFEDVAAARYAGMGALGDALGDAREWIESAETMWGANE